MHTQLSAHNSSAVIPLRPWWASLPWSSHPTPPASFLHLPQHNDARNHARHISNYAQLTQTIPYVDVLHSSLPESTIVLVRTTVLLHAHSVFRSSAVPYLHCPACYNVIPTRPNNHLFDPARLVTTQDSAGDPPPLLSHCATLTCVQKTERSPTRNPRFDQTSHQISPPLSDSGFTIPRICASYHAQSQHHLPDVMIITAKQTTLSQLNHTPVISLPAADFRDLRAASSLPE